MEEEWVGIGHKTWAEIRARFGYAWICFSPGPGKRLVVAEVVWGEDNFVVEGSDGKSEV